MQIGDGIWIVRRFGSELTRVTFHAHFDPAWSPDGRKIVFADHDTETVFTVNVDGSSLEEIPNTIWEDQQPSWQPRCNVRGTRAPDTLSGSAARELICGGGGDETIRAFGSNDAVFAGRGDDVIIGGRGRDVLASGRGSDRLVGGPGNDLLSARDGIAGNDVLAGGDGSDICIADPGDTRIGC